MSMVLVRRSRDIPLLPETFKALKTSVGSAVVGGDTLVIAEITLRPSSDPYSGTMIFGTAKVDSENSFGEDALATKDWRAVRLTPDDILEVVRMLLEKRHELLDAQREES